MDAFTNRRRVLAIGGTFLAGGVGVLASRSQTTAERDSRRKEQKDRTVDRQQGDEHHDHQDHHRHATADQRELPDAAAPSTGNQKKVERFGYKNFDIETVETDQDVEVWFNGEQLKNDLAEKHGPKRFRTHLLPFEEFESAEEMAKALAAGDEQEIFILPGRRHGRQAR